MKIENICVVGGGSSGWMTAAILQKWAPKIKVTLIESPHIGTIGVGESTIGHFNKFLKMLGLKDSDWMHRCNATYKTSIKFTDFREKGSVFHYPFGRYDMTDAPLGMMTWFELAARDPIKYPPETFAQFFHSSVDMIDANKITLEKDVIRGFFPETDLAYHIDATAFGQFLKERFCDDVTHIRDTIVDVKMTADGSVGCLLTDGGLQLEADLFIDCSGFRSMLLGNVMQEPFASFKTELPNDRAIATQIPYIDKDSEMASVTNCTALSSGWVWNIPLYHRIGTGYVYSSQFLSKEEAEAEFREHLGERGKDCEVRHIEIKNGIHERAWVKNVVGIGLANGFIEPLESTGLMLTHESLLFLVRTIIQRDGVVNQFNIDSFNFSVRDAMEGFRHFISLHYALSPRNDTPYWKHVTENVQFDEQMGMYNTPKTPHQNASIDMAYRFNTSMQLDEQMGGLPYIVAGHGMNPVNVLEISLNDRGPMLVGIEDKYVKQKAINKDVIDKLLTHYQHLKQFIHKD